MSTVYFWGTRDLDTGLYSQWFHSPFVSESGERFANAEQYMMWRKATFFGDVDIARKILTTTQPRQIKEYGRQVRGFDDSKWKKVRQSVVYKGNMLKFQQNPVLAAKLISTGNAELVEASPFDCVWGIGFRASDADNNRDRWGLNLLGKILAKVRKTLSEEKVKNKWEKSEKQVRKK